MRDSVRAMHDSVIAHGRGGTHQAREERDVIVRTSKARLEQLSIGDEALCFGRIDQDDGELFHIGRLAVWDEGHEPLVVDWRAPVAEPFYRATGRHPMGLSRRRHFTTDGPRIVAIEDEVFDLDMLEHASDLAGEGALFAALDRERSGTMRDIVATIQGEQDEIIRAPMKEVLVVQGAPGTGKTAVALHRAAYLLYTHRFPLERQGVLVLGPNPVFMRYISHVLPSLGETGVDLSTVNGLYQGVRTHVAEEGPAARVKGDARMAKVVARAVRDRQRSLPRDIDVPYGSFRLPFTVQDSVEAIAAARRRRGPHNSRRRHVEAFVAQRLHERYLEAAERSQRVGLRPGEGGDEVELSTFAGEVRRLPEVREALERMWPRLSPEELLRDLLGARPLLRLASKGILTPDEQARLFRPRPAHGEPVASLVWTDADVPLLDEASVLLGPRRKKKGDDDHIRTYGHIVVDEAQDLTPMQLRMVGRRSMSGSLTIVGDIAQATGHTPPSDWDDVLAYLPHRKRQRTVELSVNYRTPAQVMDLAAKVLAVAAPHLRPPRSVRTGEPPAFVAASRERLVDDAADAARELGAVVGGTVALICPPSLALPLADVLGLDSEISLDSPISVVPIGTAKGLEFDGVVVVEPSLLVDESPQGLRSLYVAMTRTTKRLTIVHSRPLPPNLRQ